MSHPSRKQQKIKYRPVKAFSGSYFCQVRAKTFRHFFQTFYPRHFAATWPFDVSYYSEERDVHERRLQKILPLSNPGASASNTAGTRRLPGRPVMMLWLERRNNKTRSCLSVGKTMIEPMKSTNALGKKFHTPGRNATLSMTDHVHWSEISSDSRTNQITQVLFHIETSLVSNYPWVPETLMWFQSGAIRSNQEKHVWFTFRLAALICDQWRIRFFDRSN